MLALLLLVWTVLLVTLAVCAWLARNGPPPGLSRAHRTRRAWMHG